MTTTTEQPLCSICKKTKFEHGVLNHEFNQEGQLVAKKKSPPIRVQPAGTNAGQLTGMMIRLVHVLARKGLLDDDDVKYITGPDERPPASPQDSEVGIYPRRPSS